MKTRFVKSLVAVAVAAVFSPLVHAAWYASPVLDMPDHIILHEGVPGASIVTGVFTDIVAGKRPLTGVKQIAIADVNGLTSGLAKYDPKDISGARFVEDGGQVTLNYFNDFGQATSKTYNRTSGVFIIRPASGFLHAGYTGVYDRNSHTLEVLEARRPDTNAHAAGFTVSNILLSMGRKDTFDAILPDPAGGQRIVAADGIGFSGSHIKTSTHIPSAAGTIVDYVGSGSAWVDTGIGTKLRSKVYYGVNNNNKLVKLTPRNGVVDAEYLILGDYVKFSPTIGVTEWNSGSDGALDGSIIYNDHSDGMPRLIELAGEITYTIPPSVAISDVIGVVSTKHVNAYEPGTVVLAITAGDLNAFNLDTVTTEALRPIPNPKNFGFRESAGKIYIKWDNDQDSAYSLTVGNGVAVVVDATANPVIEVDRTSAFNANGAKAKVVLSATNGAVATSSEIFAFKNVAPTSASASYPIGIPVNSPVSLIPVVIDANIDNSAGFNTAGNLVYGINNLEEITISSVTQPAHGVVTLGQSSLQPTSPEWTPIKDNTSFVYTPELNWSGTDTFTFLATDKAGASVTGTASTTITCPMMDGSATVAQGAYGTAAVDINWTANPCNIGIGASLKITSQLGDILYQEAKSGLGASGAAETSSFAVTGMPTGNHVWTVTFTGQSSTPNVKVVTGPYAVESAVMPMLQSNKDKYTIEELASVSVVPGTGSNCTMTLDESAARLDHGLCFVEWISIPAGMTVDVTAAVPTIKGYGTLSPSASVAIRASIFNTAGIKTTMGEVTKNLQFTAAQQPQFDLVMPDGKPMSFDRFTQVASIPLVRTDGDANAPCHVYTTANDAAAAAVTYGRACLLETTTLPSGLKALKEGVLGDPVLKGRIFTSGQQTIDYKITRIHPTFPPLVTQTSSKTIDVIDPSLDFVSDIKSSTLAAGLQSVDATIKTAGIQKCTLTTIERDAIDSVSDNLDNLKCLVSWTSLPEGVEQDVTAYLPKLKGAPTTIGTPKIAYSVNLLSGSDNSFTLKEGTIPLTVVAAEAPSFELTTQELVTGSGIVGIKSSGTVGTLKVTKANIGNAKVTIDSVGAESVAYSNLTLNMARDITAPSTPVWQKRDIKVVVSYMEFPQLKDERTLTVVALPQVVSPNVMLPATLLTGIQAQVQTKIPSYSAAVHGEWTAYMEAQDATGVVVWSQDNIPMNSSGIGGATIADPSVINGKTLYSVIRAKSSVEGYALEYRSKGVPVTVQEGGAPTATLQVDIPNGVAPFLAVALAVVPSSQVKNVGVVTWYASSDAGSTWAPLANNSGTALRTTFRTAGDYKVKAKLLNKYSGAESWTDIKDFAVYAANTVVVTGKTVALVGSTLALHAESTATSVKWIIEHADGTRATATGHDLTLNSDVAQVMRITAMASSETGEDLNDSVAWASKKIDVTFAAPNKMFLDVTGAKTLEIGKPGDLTGVVRTPWNNAIAGLTIVGEWTLPDGTKSQGLTLSWTPTLDDFQNSTVPTFTAWVTGFEETTKTVFKPKLYVKKYAFPTLTLDLKEGVMQAPALVRLAVNGQKDDLKQFAGAGGKLRYTWSAPDNAIGFKASSSSAYFTADMAGEYSVTVKVEDTRGNVQDIETKVTILEPAQFTYTFKTYASNQYTREPVTMLLRPMLAGGHPKERISNMKFMMDGVSIGESTKGSLSVVIPTAGDYALSFEAATSLGRTVTGTKSLTVAANKPPACVLSIKGSTAISVNAECRDPDGKIKSYAWKVDGVAVSTSGYRISTKKGVAVEVTVTDDSGAAVVYSGNT